MKKLLSILIVFCLIVTFVHSIDLSQKEIRPDKLLLTLTLSQEEKTKATDFEVYLDNKKVSTTSVSSNTSNTSNNSNDSNNSNNSNSINYDLTLGEDTPLWPEQEYELKVRLLNKDKEVTSLTKSFKTDTWAGVYAWFNKTNKNNDGKATELILTARKSEDKSQGGTYYELLDTRGSDLYKVFPIEEINEKQDYPKHKYDEDSQLALGYRLNAERFNITGVNPSSFTVDELTVSPNSYSAIIKSKISIFTVKTDFDFTFRYNEETKQKELLFIQGGDAIVKTGLFSNPEPPKEGKNVFVLVQQTN